MFQTVQVDEIFDMSKAMASESHPSYWLAQLHKADWQELLSFVDIRKATSTKKLSLAHEALAHFEFEVCATRAEVRTVWQSLQSEQKNGLVIQFRHSETN